VHYIGAIFLGVKSAIEYMAIKKIPVFIENRDFLAKICGKIYNSAEEYLKSPQCGALCTYLMQL